ncbi:hypothetical protein AALO_G00065680 [Alosa alosa]|uniref:Uncharacterized protein n=1 Tax=Alosa alosa TaxID=278164 RepID=A0AAV6H0X5_9TELE|nr:hypothetical protein AALO_G00065680 [Alosa alosa]
MSADLLRTFLSELDEYLPMFLVLFRKRDPAITNILRWLDAHDSNQNKRTTVLLGMPHCLCQDTSSILKTCEPTGPVEDVLKETSVGILIVYEDCSKCVVLQNQ